MSKQKKKEEEEETQDQAISASSAESPLRKIAHAQRQRQRHAMLFQRKESRQRISGFSLRSAVIDGDLELMDKILTKCPELLSDVMEAGEHGSNGASNSVARSVHDGPSTVH